MTELSKDNDQESSYKEAFRSQITLQLSQNCQKTVCKLSDYTVSQIQTHMTKAEAETNRQIIHIVRSSD